MNAPVTRRALLGATATVGAIGLPIMVLAGLGDLDAELFTLLDRFAVARAAWDPTDDPLDEAMARAKAAYSPRPHALLWRGDDFPRTGRGAGLSDPGEMGDERWYGFRGVEWMRNRPTSARFPGRTSPFETGDEARRLEILAAWDRWQAERQAVDDVVGYTAASQSEFDASQAWIKADDAVKVYAADDWHVREAWYGHAGSWSTAAVDDLRQRFAAWRETTAGAAGTPALAGRVAAVRRLLDELGRQVAGLEAEVASSNGRGASSDG